MKKFIKSVAATVIAIWIISVYHLVIAEPPPIGQRMNGNSAHANAVDTLLVDLSKPITTLSFTVKNNEPFTVKIINLAPSLQYTINSSIVFTPPPPLTPPANNANVVAAGQALALDADCIAKYAELRADATEAAFGLSMIQAKAMAGCPAYSDYYKISTKIDGPHSLNNETYTLTIADNATPSKTWTITVTTQETGMFITSYGLSYIPYIFAKPHTYYAQQYPPITATTPSTAAPTATVPMAQEYKILPGSSEAISEYVPSIFFHWVTRSAGSWSGSFTGGLGLGLNGVQNAISPAGFFGYSFVFHYNIGFNFGIAAHTVSNLKGVYTADQYITTNLQPSDLNEQVVRFNPFISLIFRFGSNPFPSQSANTPTLSAPPQ